MAVEPNRRSAAGTVAVAPAEGMVTGPAEDTEAQEEGGCSAPVAGPAADHSPDLPAGRIAVEGERRTLAVHRIPADHRNLAARRTAPAGDLHQNQKERTLVPRPLSRKKSQWHPEGV